MYIPNTHRVCKKDYSYELRFQSFCLFDISTNDTEHHLHIVVQLWSLETPKKLKPYLTRGDVRRLSSNNHLPELICMVLRNTPFSPNLSLPLLPSSNASSLPVSGSFSDPVLLKTDFFSQAKNIGVLQKKPPKWQDKFLIQFLTFDVVYSALATNCLVWGMNK